MKYAITKYVDAKSIEEAIKKEKKTPVDTVECIELEESNNYKVGYGR